ncbi:protein kinase C substrate 80K-H like protein [Cavenderia fasciculata]|uniref:Glucosidase 2 subunit beta n=1 Tax=Cavenderia fasciculata TaxID=261658 RepID=F4Q6G4_CACFS|nr:protein kinase C substrate 80K-H like protein [Cavenderia fasciculata]EGG16474.1 protein kinase C substrate 80K-H like protein [Cavenderia fasciculata]|eukprot:XP_004354874.1 protein kinase C substrate 80K-H like protein [Cavenderia fasciculata]
MKLLFSLFIIIVAFIAVSQCTKDSGNNNKNKLSPQFGVPPEKLEYYKGETFTCFGSGKTIPIDYVNDDYCDCPDGSDEPGTSACSNGQFYCKNKGYKGQLISSILVNDGICDCCDGSDEQSGLIKCQDSCAELSKEMRKAREEAIQKYTTGLKIKEEMINEAVEILKTKKEELEKSRKEHEPLKQTIKELEVAKEALEAKKKEREEQLEAERKLKEQIERQQNETEQAANGDTQDKTAQPEETNTNNRTIYFWCRWRNWNDTKCYQPKPKEPEDPQLEETKNGKIHHRRHLHFIYTHLIIFCFYYFLFCLKIVKATLLDTLQEMVSAAVDVISQYLPQSKISELSKIEEIDRELREKNRQLRDNIEQTEKLEKLLITDMGPDNVFLPLYGRCFDAPTKDYTYTMCPFENSKQGHTSLGRFEEWGPNHSSMSFTNGVQCWGGPKRSLKVQVECGSENKIYDVQEPSKCEYSMKFSTPALCDKEHLLVLQLEDDHQF